MRTFWVLVRKELRELLTLQVLAPFVVVVLIFAGIGGVIGEAGEESGSAGVVVIDRDGSAPSERVVDSLQQAGLDVTVIDDGDLDELTFGRDDGASGLFVEIPEGFAGTLDRGESAPVLVRTVMSDFSFVGMAGEGELRGALQLAGQSLATSIAAEQAPNVSVQQLQQPLVLQESVTIGNRTAETSVAAVAGFIGQQTLFIPIVLFMVIVFAAQLIATTIATEKENKTLETLLSYPISRTSLVVAKMFAAGLISFIAAGAYMLGMRQYMSGLETSMGGGPGADAAAEASRDVMRQLGLVFGASDYVMLGLSLFAGILLALSIAIILGAFAESVKAVGALITPLMVLLMVPYLLTMFVNLQTASPVLRWGLMAIPFTHPFMAAQNLFLGNDGAVWLGIGYQVLWFVAFALIAARIFSSDRILTMKLNLSRKKNTPAA